MDSVQTGPFKAFIGNLPFDGVQGDIEQILKHIGFTEEEVQSVQIRMIRDRETDKFKGFAYAEFTCAEDLKRVLEWNGVDYGGRPLKIDLAAQRTGGDRGGRGGRGSSRGSWSSAEPRGASERGGNWGSSEPRGGNWGSSEPRGNHGHGGSWTSVESRGGHDHQGSGSHGGYGGRPRSRPSEHEEVEIVEHPERPRLVLKPRTTDPAELEAKKKREAEEEAARRAKLFQV